MYRIIHFPVKFLLLACVLQLSFTILPTKQVKVAIKSHVDDWCIRVKGSRSVAIDNCYWKANITNGKIQENEQTFDVHPKDIDEQQGMTEIQRGRLPTPFLIRLSKSSTATAATSCLASISSNLTVEKCQLRKSRFRISGSTLPKSHSNLCTTKTHQPSNAPTRYKIVSSDQSCLEFIPTSAMPYPTLAFTPCSSEKTQKSKPAQLWQFCGKNGNCSLSPLELNWNSLITFDPPEKMNDTVCTDDKTITTSSSSLLLPPGVNEKVPTTTNTAESSSSYPTTETIITTNLMENDNKTSLLNNTTTTESDGAFLNVTGSSGKTLCSMSLFLWRGIVLLVGKHFIVNFY